jgi:glycosyltransferase involved in cell wall biosynthesis
VSLGQITPVLLTLDEAPNLPRTLATLTWARRVVVVDSGSTDGTRAIAAASSNVVWFERPFDSHGQQWAFAIRQTAIDTAFVLALDADMQVPTALRDELAALAEREELAGVNIGFQYRIAGRPLRGSVYPPQARFFRPNKADIGQAGHTQVFRIAGPTVASRSYLVHDDRKPLERFLASQARYSALEARRIAKLGRAGGVKTWLRRSLPGWPTLVALGAYLKAGGPICGAASRRYAIERLLYETLLRYRLADDALRPPEPMGR